MDIIEKRIKKNLINFDNKQREIKIFLFQYFMSAFFYGLNFIAPFIIIILNETLTATQISTIIIIKSVAKLLAEIPSGPIADKYGKKSILVFGQFLYIAVFVLLSLDRSFIFCIIAYSIWGICDALFTGTETALFYNNMKYYKIDKNYSIFNGKYDTISIITASLTSLLSALLYKNFGYNALLFSHLVFSAFGYLVLICFIKDRNRKKTANTKAKNQITILKTSIRYLFKHTTLFKIFIFIVLWKGLWLILKEFNGMFLKEITESTEMVGILDSFQKFLIAFTQFGLIATFSELKTKLNLYILSISSFLFLISSIIYQFPISFILLAIFFIFSNIISVIINAKQQEFIPSYIRSTIMSSSSFLYAIVKIILLYLFGLINSSYSYKSGFMTLAILQIVICIVFSIIISKDKHLEKKESVNRF